MENPSRESQPWLLLKYLLVNRHRPVTREELNALWPEGAGDNAARVRLNRLREALIPRRWDGKSGLVQYSAGAYRINPRYALDVDEDRLNDLLTRFWTCPEQDPAGHGRSDPLVRPLPLTRDGGSKPRPTGDGRKKGRSFDRLTYLI